MVDTHRQYNAPEGSPSDIGATQLNPHYYQRQALIEAARKQVFQKLASVTAMPKHYGKLIKRYHYLPMLDDANINDQGIDAAGVAIDSTTYNIYVPNLVNAPSSTEAAEASFTKAHAVGEYVFITDSAQWLEITAATAIGYDASTTGGASGTELSDAAVKALIEADTLGVVATVAGASITLTLNTMQYASSAAATIVASIIQGAQMSQRSGNLYGSSKDIGSIPSKMPTLGENGGRVNRVGFKRKEIQGTFEKFGFFDEYSQDSIDFDTDSELMMHVSRTMIDGANEMTEDLLQIDLLNGAGIEKFPGTATQISEVDDTAITYKDLLRLHLDLNNNRTPLTTKMNTGTRLIDSVTIDGGRFMYIGHELQPMFEAMKDVHDNPAFIPIRKYGSNTNTMEGEIGTVGHFRLVVNPEMMNHTGAGANADGNTTHYTTSGAFDVFPMLVIGDGSFTTIGFQTDGKTQKFKIIHHKPGDQTADKTDPFGETGFMSIKWWYGSMILRSERLAIIWSSGIL